MKKPPAITLILLGVLWLYWATVIPLTMEMRALSDAKSFQARLRTWVDETPAEADIHQLFTDRGTLRLGGERENQDFEAMIRHIATSSAPPWWPGAIAIVVGFISLVPRNKTAPAPPSVPGRDPTAS
jgi:hypothetical protein